MGLAAQRQREWTAAYRRAGAVTPGAPRAPEELDWRPDGAFRKLVKSGAFVESAPGKYYLSPSGSARMKERDRRRTVWAFCFFALLYALYLVLTPMLLIRR